MKNELSRVSKAFTADMQIQRHSFTHAARAVLCCALLCCAVLYCKCSWTTKLVQQLLYINSTREENLVVKVKGGHSSPVWLLVYYHQLHVNVSGTWCTLTT